MLPAMLPRRVQPLVGWSIVVVFALIGAVLLATVWTTRGAILDASDAVRCGQLDALAQAVRADLADLDALPTEAELDAIVQARSDDGLRYLAQVSGRDRSDVVEDAGTPGSGAPRLGRRGRAGGCRPDPVDGRMRRQFRGLARFKAGGQTPRFAIEVEPVQANQLRDAATMTLGVGGLAAVALLGVAFVLIRREARRAADAHARERERRLASLGEMSAVLAHEIKNPLASLKGNAQLLAHMLPAGPGTEKARTKVDRVVDEAIRLEQLTKDLLSFVRTGTIERTAVDPAAVVRDAAAGVAGEIAIDTAQAPPVWSLDAGRIRQVVINLLDNAIAAGPPVSLTVRRDRNHLVIEVADRGPGVPEDDRDKIFEPFFTGKTQGTGLGLAIVRRVVELHQGTIAVYPHPGGGAMFRAEIPEG